MELGDLSEEQALAYLGKRGVPPKIAGSVVEVTGGRMLQLMAAAEVLQRGGNAQGVVLIGLPLMLKMVKRGICLSIEFGWLIFGAHDLRDLSENE